MFFEKTNKMGKLLVRQTRNKNERKKMKNTKRIFVFEQLYALAHLQKKIEFATLKKRIRNI